MKDLRNLFTSSQESEDECSTEQHSHTECEHWNPFADQTKIKIVEGKQINYLTSQRRDS